MLDAIAMTYVRVLGLNLLSCLLRSRRLGLVVLSEILEFSCTLQFVMVAYIL